VKNSIIFVAALFIWSCAQAETDFTHKKSQNNFADTLAKVAAAITANSNLTKVATIDHSANASAIGESLRPATLIIFGNAKLGTKLMLSNLQAAIDLPMKILVWQDMQNNIWVTYNNPIKLAKRHLINDREQVIETMINALAAIAKDATE